MGRLLKRHPTATMIGGSVLAAWIPFWNFLSTLSTLDFMRTSTGQPSIGTLFLPTGIASGFTVVGTFVMVLAFVRLAERNSVPQPEKLYRSRNTQESLSQGIETISVPSSSEPAVLLASVNAVSHKPNLQFGSIIVLPDGREIVTCKQEDLQAVYNANTIDQCSRLLRGRWVKLSGSIDENFGGGHIILESNERPMLSLRFDEYWIEQMSRLARGSTIVFRGRLSRVDQTAIGLKDCEMV